LEKGCKIVGFGGFSRKKIVATKKGLRKFKGLLV
jgi:hypothetical protein